MTSPDANRSDESPAARFAVLRAAGATDLDSFLRETNPPSVVDVLNVARIDMAQEWKKGNRVPVESYFARLPVLSMNADAAVDLIFDEYLCRERAGENPNVEEYVRRFPDYAIALRKQIDGYRAMATPTPPLTEVGEPQATLTPPVERGPFPHKFGRYTLQKVLGVGGMGVVYLAEDSQLGRQVALKIPRLDPEDAGGANRFLREARMAAALHHPNLCPVYDVGRIDGKYYLTMPVIPGVTLAERVKQGGILPLAESVRIVTRIAAGMQVAHEAGIIHRDLKPQNVILNSSDEPVVTDFGLARRVSGTDPRLTSSGAVLGTPMYLPPEQIGGAPEAMGPAGDVYSLGAIFYELLAGRPPFKGASGEVLRQVLQSKPAPPSSLRPGLDTGFDAICLRALEKDPKHRFPSMAEFGTALERSIARPRSNRVRYAVLGIALVLIVAGIAWAVWPPHRTSTAPTGPPVIPQASKDKDYFQPGSRWTGEFRFGPADDFPKSAFLHVTERTGTTFRGRYISEGKFEWEVEGTIRNGEVRWDLKKAANQLA
ncbi:MAG TPA: serine/threonine-protein kinase, partial [Fimbriiglobus sp.]